MIAAAVTVVAYATPNMNQGALVAIEKDTVLLDGSTNPARIVHMGITGDDQFRSFTGNGLKLFDAAVAWALEIDPPVSEAPEFDQFELNVNGDLVISWTGEGQLFEATDVLGPFTRSANQNNPQARPTDASRMFFLVK